MDYRALGLKCGLEVHQQLASRKLFCEDVSKLFDTPGSITFRRQLRPTQSELGEVDAAAIEEARRRLTFVYEATDNTCLVEADEEPPHHPNEHALDIALAIALLLNARPVSEVHFMRKIVIDGSNTAGFQRSALVALGGSLSVAGKEIGVPTILLEEDAARKVREAEGEVVYRLDRLGIPLVEIATTPDIESPAEARDVALAIGRLLRATRKVLRGIGTIREDLNVSIRGGARIEIKGVQDLRLISTFVEKEVDRQRMLLDVASELRRRGVTSVPETVQDVTAQFASTESKVLREAMARGGRVLARPLPGFSSLLKGKLGPELAAHARIAGVGGIFHSDELPGYGIVASEVDAVKRVMKTGTEDAFVLVASGERRGREAMELIGARARAALRGVPEETREPRPDGSTAYARPLPGKARMYPETDVTPIRISEDRIRTIRESLPERPEATIERLEKQYGIHPQQARQVFEDGMLEVFELVAKDGGDAKVVATTLTYTASELRREGLDVDRIPDDHWRELFALLRAGRFAKEAIPDLVREMVRRGVSPSQAMTGLGLAGMDRREVEAVVEEVLDASDDLLATKGEAAEKALMGRAMDRVRGRADGKLVSEVLRSKLRKRLEKKGVKRNGKAHNH